MALLSDKCAKTSKQHDNTEHTFQNESNDNLLELHIKSFVLRDTFSCTFKLRQYARCNIQDGDIS